LKIIVLKAACCNTSLIVSLLFPHCQVCYARILDLKRKFLEAALRYYDISQIEKRQIGDQYVLLHFIDVYIQPFHEVYF
jgi:hypothetical protein